MKRLTILLWLMAVSSSWAADLTVTAANVATTDGSPVVGTAGETLTAGQPIYQNSTRLYKAKADTAAHALCVGVTLNGASAGQPVSYLKSGGTLNPGATLTVGETYVVSPNNAGGIAPIGDLSSGKYPTILGIATTSSALPLRFIIPQVAKP